MDRARIEEIVIAEMQNTRERHARETGAVAADVITGMSGRSWSRETLRKATRLVEAKKAGDERATVLAEAMDEGNISINRAYNIWKGRKKVALTVYVKPETRNLLQRLSFESEREMSEIVEEVLQVELPKHLGKR